VIARHLAVHGVPYIVALLGSPAELAGDARTNYEILARANAPLVDLSEIARTDLAALLAALDRHAGGARWYIDALLGTGLEGDVREPIRSAIEALEGSPVPIVAVDGPSGLDGESGRVRGAAARAEITVTLGFPKPGLFLAEGPQKTGRLIVVPLL